MRRFLTFIASCLMVAVSGNSNAQVTPDDSLPNNSVVSDELEITGGTTAGSNLFHSFTEFSLDTGQTAYFNNDSAIDNIISRVTGNSVSNIDGLLRANGAANLFLINPNGIIFGENAALDIGGSFIGSTADRLQFADGSEFSAVDPNAEPLLTVNIPIGLQYGNDPGDITVRGTGNNLSIDPETFTVDRSDRPAGLAVSNGNTLALLGGNVFLPGGNLTAGEGRVAVGSIGSNGLVRLDPDTLGWNFNYDRATNFQNIDLSEAASVEVSGNSGGEVRLQGQNISIVDGSAILADTLGSGAGRVLEILATESLEVVGFAADNLFQTRLSTDVNLDATGDGGDLIIDTEYLAIEGAQVSSGTFGLGNAGNLRVVASDIEVIGGEFFSNGLFTQADLGDTGKGGNISINTNSLFVAEGAAISTTTFGSGDAGNLNIRANTVELEGFSEFFAVSSNLAVTTEGSGNGGNLTLIADSLSITRGAEISTTTFGSGNAGNLNIQANAVELQGGAAQIGASSGLFANADEDSLGDGGNLNIDTNSLSIVDGAQIQALTDSVGKAGTITIDARQIDLAGTSPSGNSSGISAIAARGDGNGGNIEINTDTLEVTQGAQIATSTRGFGDGGDLNVVAEDFVRLSGTSNGDSSGLFANALLNDGAGGNLRVETDLLAVLDGATISVGNFPSNNTSPIAPGEGPAGNLTVIASEILLDEATITADTKAGDLGNLDFQTNLLILRRGSRISTDAQQTATGGNITINAEDGFLVAFPQENSDITANAEFGDGGRVDIEALEIFGIEPRADLTPKSDITTSSEFGIAGNVIFQTQDLNPAEDLTQLPDAPNPPQIARGCQEIQASGSSFVNIGQGGLNPQPDAALGSGGEELIGDVQLPDRWSTQLTDDTDTENADSTEIVEAEGWIVNQQGKIELIADVATQSRSFNCQLN